MGYVTCTAVLLVVVVVVVVELKSDWLWLIGALIAQCSGLCDHSLQYGQIEDN